MSHPRSCFIYTVALNNLRNGVTSSSTCKWSYEVWNKIHKQLTAIMKARVHQWHRELKITKKLNSTAFEFFKAIVNSLLLGCDLIIGQDQIEVTIDGVPREYSPFVMQVYGRADFWDNGRGTQNLAKSDSHDVPPIPILQLQWWPPQINMSTFINTTCHMNWSTKLGLQIQVHLTILSHFIFLCKSAYIENDKFEIGNGQ